MIPKASSIVKIGAAVAVAVVIILQALQSNEQGKIEKISDAILSLEQKVSTELEAVEKEEKAKALPSVSPSASAATPQSSK
jgi:sulfite exporter TauE/SafE